MGKIYWNYETSIGDTTCVSIRSSGTVRDADYYSFLGEFATHFNSRITTIGYPLKTVDGSYICIISLKNRTMINFRNEFSY
ncbi:hypothetical protein [Acanthamoeba polyphaga mimivirus]|uniref:Uncharacterized protein n=1 Tax=Acanthamoeba polyphaga mimivirus TaxID=212035 RepID=A0A0G2Y0A2_MIMIV|nr:hypothetical protein [Acanthamoeba polyphaga mimivirus]